MKDISDSYFDRYRRRLADLNSIDEEIEQVRQKYDLELAEISQRRMRTSNEIEEMRRVITTMIDHGVDPIEAKLRNENSDTIWSSMNHNNWDLNAVSVCLDQTMSDENQSPFSTTSITYGSHLGKINGY